MNSFEEMGAILSRETSKLLAGEITIAKVKAIVSIARTAIAAALVLLEYTKVTGKDPGCNFFNLFHKSEGEGSNGRRKTSERLVN